MPDLRAAAGSLCLALACASYSAEAIRILREVAIDGARAVQGEFELRLSAAVLRDSGWNAESVAGSLGRAAKLLEPCGIRTTRIDLAEVEAAARYRSLFTPVSRRLAAELRLPRPAIFFVAGTRERPAFDAEAIGRGNSRTRPEMADTVWVVSGTRDLEVALAHELVHVLSDSGEHSEAEGNLMRDETRADATALTPAQCRAMVGTAVANGLLRPAGN